MKAFLLLATLGYFSQSFGTEAVTTGVKTPTVDFGIGSAGGSFYNQYRANLENEKKEFAKDKERYDQRKFLMEERGMATAAGKPPIEIKGDLQRGDQWSTADIIKSVLNGKTQVGLLELNQADFSQFEKDVRSGKYNLLKYRNIIKIEDNPVKMLIAITNGYPKGESMSAPR